MSWTAPMTAVANTAFTAAQFNTYVRDNLNMTAPALATTAGRLFVSTGVNSIAERSNDEVITSGADTTTSGSFTDLAGGANPSLSITTGTQALVWVGCFMSNSGTSGGNMSFAVSGSSTIAADDARAWAYQGSAGAAGIGCWFGKLTGLTAGSNTFTAKYKVGGGTGTFSLRRIGVLAL